MTGDTHGRPVQTYIAGEVRKAAEALESSLDGLPENKRDWSPLDKGRSAIDQVAECALLCGYTADVVRLQAWPEDMDLKAYPECRNVLAQDEAMARMLLKQNAEDAAAVIAQTPDEALTKEISTPWGSMPLQKIISMAAWNMSYHEGQINYIASLLGCLH